MKDEIFLVFNANVEMVEYSSVSSGQVSVRSQDQPSSSVQCLCWREEPAPGPVVLCNHLNKHYSAVIQLSGGKLEKILTNHFIQEERNKSYFYPERLSFTSSFSSPLKSSLRTL